MLNWNPKLKLNTSSQIYKQHLIFLSTLLNLNGEQTKANMGRGILFIRRFVLKVINNESKILTHHEIIDCIAQEIVSIITQVF